MKTNNARILVIGAGVNGSICAVGLYNAGVDVTILARGKRYEALQDKGIIIENPLKHTRTVTKIPVISALEPEDVYDYVLVVIRKNQISDLLPVLARNRSLNVVFMSNNLSGPDEYTAALSKERVMLGFVFGGGKREDDVVFAVSGVGGALGAIFGGVPFGEIDGAITPRLKRLVGIFHHAGLDAKVSSHISDYLATHAALVALITCSAAQYSFDRASLARYSAADFGLLIDALREMLKVLPALGYRITPPKFVAINVIPRFILVVALRAFVKSDMMDLSMADMSMSQARDEMLQLAREFERMVNKSGLPVPAIRKLFALIPAS